MAFKGAMPDPVAIRIISASVGYFRMNWPKGPLRVMLVPDWRVWRIFVPCP